MKAVLNTETLKGAVGVSATTGAAYVSTLQHVTQLLQIASLCVGIAVGVATFISIVRKLRKQKPKNQTENQ